MKTRSWQQGLSLLLLEPNWEFGILSPVKEIFNYDCCFGKAEGLGQSKDLWESGANNCMLLHRRTGWICLSGSQKNQSIDDEVQFSIKTKNTEQQNKQSFTKKPINQNSKAWGWNTKAGKIILGFSQLALNLVLATETSVYNLINWYEHFHLFKTHFTNQVHKQDFGLRTTTFCNGCAQHTDAGLKQCRLLWLQLQH